jgi:hypothetical protein
MEHPTKESLLAEIEALIAYGTTEPTINPTLLAYLEIHDLENIKAKLLRKTNTLTDEDKAWLEQFKRYD